MASLVANKATEYIGKGIMGYCGHACREFIHLLPENESTEWTMMNIRAISLTSDSCIYLQDVRGRVTPSHVVMINTTIVGKWNLEDEVQFSHVVRKFKVYDPLYNMEFPNMLYYCCFLYTKLDFTSRTVNIGDTVDLEMQQQHDYSHTYWHPSGPGRYHWPTCCLRFNPSDLIKYTGIDLVKNAKDAMETFNKEKLKQREKN